MRTALAFGKNDLINIRRDSLLLYAAVVPWLLLLLVRLLVPWLTGWLHESRGFDLVPYYPLILSFIMMQLPMIVGVVMGLLVLDERDAGTITALRVTPLSMTSYALYRISVTFLYSMLTLLVLLPISGLVPMALIPALVPISLLASLLAPLFALLISAFASNKLEGLALMKGFGIMLLGPLAAYFIQSDWQVLIGVLPTYWSASAYWIASEGGNFWPSLLAGLVYNSILLVWLLRRFQRKLSA